MKLIDADELEKDLFSSKYLPRRELTAEYVKGWIKANYTVKPKTGEWNDIGGVIRWGCPFCHHAYDTKSNFCPNCGADLRGGEQDEAL